MTERRRIKDVMRCLSCMLVLITAATGCVRDNEADCIEDHTLVITAYDPDGTKIGSDNIEDVSLFIFDKDSRFVRKVETSIGDNVALTIPAGESLLVVAWGNLNNGTQVSVEPALGDPVANCFVELAAIVRSASYVQPPGDLFRGHITLASQDRGKENIVPIHREVGSMGVTVRNLKPFAGYEDNNYSVVVRETPSAVSFTGSHAGGKVGYRPQGSFAGGNDEYRVEPFNMLPGSGLFLDIYHGTMLVATVSKDNQGNPVTVQKGLLTNVLIDLKATVSVSISLTGWGEQQMWKEY